VVGSHWNGFDCRMANDSAMMASQPLPGVLVGAMIRFDSPDESE